MPNYLQRMLFLSSLPPTGWRKAKPLQAQHHCVAHLSNISSVIKDALIREMLRLIKNRNLHTNEAQKWKETWKKIHLILIWAPGNESAPCGRAGEPAGAVHRCRISKQWTIIWEEEQQNLRLHNSDFTVRKVQSSKTRFHTVEESTKEISIGTKILAAEF